MQQQLLLTLIMSKLQVRSIRSSLSVPKSTFSSLSSSIPPNPNPYPSSSASSAAAAAPWLTKWPPLLRSTPSKQDTVLVATNEDRAERAKPAPGGTAIDRIVHQLRNLGLHSDDDVDDDRVIGEGQFGDLLKRDWIRPDTMLVEEDRKRRDSFLSWEKEREEEDEKEEHVKGKRKIVTAPTTLAELTMEESELRRLRREGMRLKEKVNVAKAGVTRAVLEKIHEKWRMAELVRLKFHEALARDMKTAHQIVERRTGGLVIWSSGSVMVVYRGSNYEGPATRSLHDDRGRDLSSVADVSAAEGITTNSHNEYMENMTQEEVEYDELLDGLGPRFVDWWGTGVLPVDGDLLPQTIPGFKPPLRLLPVGTRAEVSDAELTTLRKLTKSLPCHFALGRNRHHQGLAAAIIKLWEKSLVVKIAVKQGVQNTNNKLMAEELKRLTGGVLLMRNKYHITIYRGKDFVPTSVATALAERQELTKNIQDGEEQIRNKTVVEISSREEKTLAAGTLSEFYEAQAAWGREMSTKEREKMIASASRAKTVRQVNKIEHKLNIAQAKKHRAEELLAKIEAPIMPAGPPDDHETITNEERFMFRKVGLSMKAYLPLGIRGIFDGVIENMHLHWKFRELVKLITKQKTLAFVEETARLLEYESGGILVAIERTPKGYALIYYRGKNYHRPISIRPQNMLTKQKALKRAVALQRHEVRDAL